MGLREEETTDIGRLELRDGAIWQCIATEAHGLRWKQVMSPPEVVDAINRQCTTPRNA